MDALERAVHEMQVTVDRLADEVAFLRAAGASAPTVEQAQASEAAAAAPPGAGSVPLEQVFCPRCGGGNPPDARVCRWCKLLLREGSATMPPAPPPPAEQAEAAGTQETAQPSAGTQTPTGGPTSSAPRTAPAPPRAPALSIPDEVRSVEFWLNKVGIVLFLFGVAFLFKYAVDQGWLTEEVRLGLGLLLGTILLGFGLWLHRSRPGLSQVLLGGSVVTYYITAYAAYMLFPDLHIPFEVAFDFMAVVTLMALVLSLAFGQVTLSLVGVVGGLLTPFVLNNRLDVPALMGYTCLLLALAADVYLVRGWRSVLWVSFVGGWFVIWYGYVVRVVLAFDAGPRLEDRWALQGGVAFMLLAFWALPVLREVLSERNPGRWGKPEVTSLVAAEYRTMAERHVVALVVLTPLLAYALSTGIWTHLMTQEQWGWVGLVAGVVFAVLFFPLRKIDELLAYTHVVVGIGLFTIGMSALLGSNLDVLVLALSVEALGLILVAHRFSDQVVMTAAELLYIPLALAMLERLREPQEYSLALLNPRGITDIIALGMAFGASLVASPERVGTLLRIAVHFGVFAVVWREFFGLDRGFESVLLALAAYVVLLHLAATLWPRSRGTEQLELETSAHIASAAVGAGLLGRIIFGLVFTNPNVTPLFNLSGALDFAVLVAGALALTLTVLRRDERRVILVYALWLHLTFLGWLWQEVGLLESGNAWVSITWGVYALVLLGLWVFVRRESLLFYMGMSTLFAISAKLFVVDVAMYHLPTMWRILLFLGFGTLFLVLSYFFGGTIRRMLSDDAGLRERRARS